MNSAPNLPWPFKPGEIEPYLNVEIAPNEYVTVVLAGDYKNLIAEYLQLRDDYQRLHQAATEVETAAKHVKDVWAHYGRYLAD